jgi:hypothetical protein
MAPFGHHGLHWPPGSGEAPVGQHCKPGCIWPGGQDFDGGGGNQSEPPPGGKEGSIQPPRSRGPQTRQIAMSPR